MEQGDLPMLVFSNEDIDICQQTIFLRHMAIVQAHVDVGLLGILAVLDSSGVLLVFSSCRLRTSLCDRSSRNMEKASGT